MLTAFMGSNSNTVDRAVWLDACKGVCIVLVVYGHISGGLEAADSLAHGSFWLKLRDWVYLFHMPAFFALSGIFATKLTTLSGREFLLGRLRTIFFPYVVWTVIIVAAQFSMARFVNNPPDLSRASRFLMEPYGYGLWFLYSLLLISVVYYFLACWKIPPTLILILAVFFSWLASRNVFGFWPIFNTSMSFFIYYVAAACARSKILLLFSSSKCLAPLLAGAGLLLAMTILYQVWLAANWPFHLVLAALGIAGVICLAKGLAQTPAGWFWAFLGIFSLEIYLGHPLWGTVSRVLLLHSKLGSPTVLVLGGVLLGIGGSLVVGILCRRWNFPYLFKWPAKVAAKP